MLENPFECECGAGDYGETLESDISLHQEQYLINTHTVLELNMFNPEHRRHRKNFKNIVFLLLYVNL